MLEQKSFSIPPVPQIDKELPPLTSTTYREFRIYARRVRIQLEPGPRGLEQLYDDIYNTQELSIIVENGERKRYGRVAVIDVFYKARNGKVYTINEERFKLKSGRSAEEFMNGDISAVVPSAPRPADTSISERIGLSGNGLRRGGEDPKTAAARALREELFDHALDGKTDTEKERVRRVLRGNLKTKNGGRAKRIERDGKTFGNSYQGLTSVYHEYGFSIMLTPDMKLPILDDGNNPKPMYEVIPDKGYVNRYSWKEMSDMYYDSSRKRFSSLPKKN